MAKYLKWILPGIVGVAAVILLVVGFMHVRAKDAYTVKIVAIENALNGISDSIEELTGVPAAHIEIPAEYIETAVEEEPSEAEDQEEEPLPQAEETSEPEETEAPDGSAQTAEETAAPRTTATPRPTATPRRTATSSAATGGSNSGSAATSPEDTGDSNIGGAGNTDVGDAGNADTGDTGDAGDVDDGGDTHVHNWVTETIPAQGHYETSTTRILVGEEPEYTDDEGGWHPAVPIYSDVTETVWVTDVEVSTRTFCSICGAVG